MKDKVKKTLKEKRDELKVLLNEAVVKNDLQKFADYLTKGYEYQISKDDNRVIDVRQLGLIMNNKEFTTLWDNSSEFNLVDESSNDDDDDENVKTAKQLELGKKILNERFLQGRYQYDTENKIRTYRITGDKICSMIGEDQSDTDRYLRAAVGSFIEGSTGRISTLGELANITNLWLAYTKFINADTQEVTQVYRYGNPYINKPSWVEHRATWTPDDKIDFPILKEMFSRIKYGPQVAALFWGVYSGKYKGRQCLWLQGDGGEGKSTLINFLCDQLFKKEFGYISTDDDKVVGNPGRFFIDYVKDSKVIVFPDCTDTNLLNKSLIKSISSGIEAVTAEGKGIKSKTVSVDTAIMVVSNFLPRIEDAEFSISRAMVTSMSKRVDADGNALENDQEISKKMEVELPGFLHWAESQFDLLFKGDTIQMPPDYPAYIDEIIGYNDSERRRLIEDNFIIHKGGVLPVEDFKTAIRKSSDFRDNDLAKLIEWFNRKYSKVVQKKVHTPTKTQYYTGIRTKTEKERNDCLESFRASLGLGSDFSEEIVARFNPDGTIRGDYE